jgi:type I restriction-modification system DNA methylase subunit
VPDRLSQQFLSEDDFIANRLLPDLKDGAKELKMETTLDFHKNVRIKDVGWADVTVSLGGREVLVIEAKFRKKSGSVERDIEPRDPEVIRQALGYAANGGFPYYATCNTGRLVLFQLRPGYTPYESEIASFDYSTNEDWPTSVLRYVLGLETISLKAPDDSLVDTLKEAYADIWPEFLKALRKRLREDSAFARKYEEWLKDQGLKNDAESLQRISKETAYLQINKLVFYKVIRISYPHLPELKVADDEDIEKALRDFYLAIMDIDYKAVYQKDIISEIPITTRVDVRLRTLIDTLSQFDFAKFKSDFVGRVYEKLIPPTERKELGQFYTPPSIVDLICRLTINKPDAAVLDPGCGSGGFLVGAYQRLRKLSNEVNPLSGSEEATHQELLKKIYGVDINQFPAHLSVINLTVQSTKNKSNKVNVVVKDFFDLEPGTEILSGFESLDGDWQAVEIRLPAHYDTILANPPYIRQELLSTREKAKIKKVIEKEFKGVSVGPSQKSRKIVLDKQSDIYVYFFMHGLAFLKNGGKLGFIASNKWLEVEYGEAFQDFLRQNCRVELVMEFDRAVFADADVNTAIVILQKENDAKLRDSNLVRFVRIKQRLTLETIVDLVERARENFEDDRIRVSLVQQKSLPRGKWNVFLRAPAVFNEIVTNPKVKNLGEIADVFFGIKTGYNDYFILNETTAKEWEIEKRYLKRVITSPKKVKGLIVRPEDLDEYLLLCHESKESLDGKHVLKYIEHGEKLKVKIERTSSPVEVNLPRVPSIRGRERWYDLPEFDIPPIVFQELYDTRTRALWNDAGAHARAPLYYCIPHEHFDPRVIVSFLNCSLAQLMLELYGRSYGGGVLDVKVYELKLLPVLNPSILSSEEKASLWRAFLDLDKAILERVREEAQLSELKSKSSKNEGLFEHQAGEKLESALAKERKAQMNLDIVVYKLLGISNRDGKRIEAGLAELQEIRRLRKLV